MNRIFAFSAAVLIFFVLLVGGLLFLGVFFFGLPAGTFFAGAQPAFAAQKKAVKQVVVYNWSEYIPQDVLGDFTKETGIRVAYSTFESNEAMFAAMRLPHGASYDVVVPSAYFVEQMRDGGLLQPIDHERLPNLKNLDPTLLDQSYDPGNAYSIPYMWGVVGLACNSKYVAPENLRKWADLLRPEYAGRIVLTDDLRDAFGLALRAKGHSINSRNEDEIKAAYAFLAELKPSVRVFDVTAVKQALISEEVWLGPIWNGDFLVAKEENAALVYVFPEEGPLLWVDNFVIPSAAKNVDNAYTFINYLLRPDIAARCVQAYKYSTPNLEAVQLLPKDMRENSILVPGPEELKNAEMTQGVGNMLRVYEQHWDAMKALQ